MKKIVINECYGGFGLSKKALDKLAFIKNKSNIWEHEYWRYGIDRDDPDLVEVVDMLGHESWSQYSKLKIVEIPEGVEWQIEDYDGLEWIAEKHRTWR